MPQAIQLRTPRDFLEALHAEMAPYHGHLCKLLLSTPDDSLLELINREFPEIRRSVRARVKELPSGDLDVTFWADGCGEVNGEALADVAESLALALRVPVKGA